MIPLGDFLLHFFRGVTPIVGKAGEAGVEFPLDFVVEFDAKHPVAPTFDLISYLVIEPVEFRVVNGFFGLLEPMIGSLVRAKNLPARQKLLAFLRESHYLDWVVLRVCNARRFHEALTGHAFQIVLHPGMVAVVSELGQVVRSYDAELASFRERMNLGIPQRIVFVPVRVLASCTLRKDSFDAFLASQRRAFCARVLPLLAVELVGPVFLSVDL